MRDRFKISICQMKVTAAKQKNIEKAMDMLKSSVKSGTDIAVLPEMFNCPYGNKKFKDYSESVDNGHTLKAMSQISKDLGIYIVAGSIPELFEGRIYNSCFVFDRQGSIIGKHRKMHLFDIDIPGKIKFKESDTLAAGNEVTVLQTEFCKIGVAICYDMRFPELMRLMALKGAKLIVIPAAFNMVTGPAHWELILRNRALDNQVYMAAASPARDENSSYVAYGHSMVTTPWGEVLKSADEKEQIISADIDMHLVEKIRNELPLLKHRRTDIYKIVEK